MGVGGQRHAPAALPWGKTRYPLYRRLGGPQGRSGRGRKISPPPTGIRSPDRPARSESLYRLSYLGPLWLKRILLIQTMLLLTFNCEQYIIIKSVIPIILSWNKTVHNVYKPHIEILHLILFSLSSMLCFYTGHRQGRKNHLAALLERNLMFVY